MTRRERNLLILTAVVAVGAASAPFLRPPLLRAIAVRARREVTIRAERDLRAPVALGEVGVSLVPTVLVLNDLRLEADGAWGLRAGSSLARVEMRGDPRAFLDWGSRPIAFTIDRPELHVVLPPAGLPGAA